MPASFATATYATATYVPPLKATATDAAATRTHAATRPTVIAHVTIRPIVHSTVVDATAAP